MTEKKFMHKNLADSLWSRMSLIEQLANVGSDVERTIEWKRKGNLEYSEKAFDRVLELLYFIVIDPRNRKRLKEVVRMREMLIDYFMYDNQYEFTDEYWQNYFYDCGYAAALKRRR